MYVCIQSDLALSPGSPISPCFSVCNIEKLGIGPGNEDSGAPLKRLLTSASKIHQRYLAVNIDNEVLLVYKYIIYESVCLYECVCSCACESDLNLIMTSHFFAFSPLLN